MRVGIYDPYLDTLGGGERYVLTAAECLSKKHKVSIFWDDKYMLSKAEAKFGLNLSKVNCKKNIFTPKTSRLKRWISLVKFDCIFFLSDGSIPVIPGKKLFVHFQAPLSLPEHKKSKVKLSRVTNVICNSHYTKKHIDSELNINSIVVYPPVEVDSFPKRPNKKNSILTVGRYSRIAQKGNFKKHKTLITSFKSLVDSGLKNWKFHIVISNLPHDKERVDSLIEYAKDYPIVFHRDIDHEKVTKLYSESKIYWHAAGFGEDLEKHPERAEHFGISTVEAMAAGCVPIVFSAGGLQESVEHDVSGYLWKTRAELEKMTKKLTDNETVRKKIAKKSVTEAQFFNKKRFCIQMLETVI